MTDAQQRPLTPGLQASGPGPPPPGVSEREWRQAKERAERVWMMRLIGSGRVPGCRVAAVAVAIDLGHGRSLGRPALSVRRHRVSREAINRDRIARIARPGGGGRARRRPSPPGSRCRRDSRWCSESRRARGERRCAGRECFRWPGSWRSRSAARGGGLGAGGCRRLERGARRAWPTRYQTGCDPRGRYRVRRWPGAQRAGRGLRACRRPGVGVDL